MRMYEEGETEGGADGTPTCKMLYEANGNSTQILTVMLQGVTDSTGCRMLADFENDRLYTVQGNLEEQVPAKLAALED
jgi:hypothetical protein